MCRGTMKIKGLAHSLGSMGARIDDEDLVFVREYVQFWTSIGVHETFPNFQGLIALLFSEEQRNGGLATESSQQSTFYSN